MTPNDSERSKRWCNYQSPKSNLLITYLLIYRKARFFLPICDKWCALSEWLNVLSTKRFHCSI